MNIFKSVYLFSVFAFVSCASNQLRTVTGKTPPIELYFKMEATPTSVFRERKAVEAFKSLALVGSMPIFRSALEQRLLGAWSWRYLTHADRFQDEFYQFEDGSTIRIVSVPRRFGLKGDDDLLIVVKEL